MNDLLNRGCLYRFGYFWTLFGLYLLLTYNFVWVSIWFGTKIYTFIFQIVAQEGWILVCNIKAFKNLFSFFDSLHQVKKWFSLWCWDSIYKIFIYSFEINFRQKSVFLIIFQIFNSKILFSINFEKSIFVKVIISLSPMSLNFKLNFIG